MKSNYKMLAALAMFLISGMAFAMQGNGVIEYRTAPAVLTEHTANLEGVNLQGGQVELSIDGKVFSSDRVVTKEENGRLVLFLYFTDFPKAANGDVAVFIGTLLENAENMKYYGDVFVGRQMDVDLDNYTLAEHHEDLYFIAGFHFDIMKR